MIFFPKKARLGIKASMKMMIMHQMEIEKALKETGGAATFIDCVVNNTEKLEFHCPKCEFKAKSKAGLGAHMRKHKEGFKDE